MDHRLQTGDAMLVVLFLATHPALYFSASDLPRLRNPQTAAQQEIKQALVDGSSYADTQVADLTFELDRGRALATFAIDCAITNDARICGDAHRWLMDIVALSTWEAGPALDFLEASYVSGVAIAYDVLTLNSSDAAKVRTRLAAEAARIYAQSGTAWWAHEWMQNHNWVDLAALGLAALVLDGEVPDPTCDWLKVVVDDYQQVGTRLQTIGDGSWHEGYAYEGSSVAAWAQFTAAYAHAANSCFPKPALADNPWLQAFGKLRVISSLPERMYQSVLMHGDWFGWSNEEVLFALRLVAARFGDGEAEWLAEKQSADRARSTYGFEQDFTALEYVVFDPNVAAHAPTARDLYLSDLQGVVARSGWDAGAKVLAVKAGAFGGLSHWGSENIDFGHDHDDDLAFWLYGNGQWLAPEAEGYATHGHCSGGPAVWNSSYHNTLGIDGMGQLGDDENCRDSADGKVPLTRKSTLFAHVETDGFVYSAMDGTALYPASLGLDQVSRQVLFLDRDCVVVRDFVKGNHTITWNTHALDAIVRDGDWIRAESKNDQALGYRVLAPASWTMSIASDQLPHGPNAKEYIDPDLTISHLQLNAQTESFLVLMCPETISGWAQHATAAPIADRGFTLSRNGQAFEWAFGDGPQSQVSVGDLDLEGVTGGVVGDARYVLIRGTRLAKNGRELVSGDAAAGGLEVRVSTGVEVSAVAATQARIYAPTATAATWNGQAVAFARDPNDADYVLIPAVPMASPSPSDTPSPSNTPAESEPGPSYSPARAPDLGMTTSSSGGCDLGGGTDGGWWCFFLLAVLQWRKKGRKPIATRIMMATASQATRRNCAPPIGRGQSAR